MDGFFYCFGNHTIGYRRVQHHSNLSRKPFFTTKPFSNTGLGLSMSYGVIKRFGGEVEVESKVGHGTAFTIILPVGLKEKAEVPVSLIIKKGC